MIWTDKNLIEILMKGGIAVMPTDTIYGIVGRAKCKSTVEGIYAARKRAPEKPCIILIGNTEELEKFNIVLSNQQKKIIENYDSGPTSFILDCEDEQFSYLHRGTKTLAFRIPAHEELRNLLLQTGPLIAPSANREGLPPAKNIEEAKKYFESMVGLYVDGGEISGKPSRVVRLYKDGTVSIIRK